LNQNKQERIKISTQRDYCKTCGEICITSETSDYNSKHWAKEINGKLMCYECRQKLKGGL